jgi:hypothetical protein
VKQENLESTDTLQTSDSHSKTSNDPFHGINGKLCSNCRKQKSFKDFGWRNKSLGSLMSWCKKCRASEREKKVRHKKCRKVSSLESTKIIDVSADDFIESTHINYLTDLAIDLFLDFSHKKSDQGEAA